MNPFEQFLAHLAIIMEFPSLKPDQQGACLLIMKKTKIPLLFEYDDRVVPNTILLSSPIAEIKAESKQLIGNSLHQNWKMEEVLSLHAQDHQLYLHRRLSPTIEVEQLHAVIESFLGQIKQCQQKLFSPPPSVSDAGPPLYPPRYKA